MLGECKSKGSISREDKRQFAKYEALAKEIQVDTLILSTIADDWTEDAKSYIDEMKGGLSQFGIGLDCFSAAELL